MVQDSVTASKMNESESEGRKWSKPIMEKRRRERINRSLDELKRLVLEAQNRDSSRYTKLEKADILEMTVKHLRGLRSRQKSAAAAALVSQTLIPGAVNVGGCGCEVGHYVIPDNVIMETRDRAHTSPHLVGISTNIQDRSYIDSSGPCAPSAMARDRSFSTGAAVPNSQGVGHSRVCQPLHVNTAVQFIPICSSSLPNSNSFPGTLAESNESYYYSHGEQFWRPF